MNTLKLYFKYIVLAAILALCIGTASAIFLFSLEWVTKVRTENLWIIIFLPIACAVMGMELFGTAAGIYSFIVCLVAYLFSFNTSIYSSQIKQHTKYKFI